MSGLPYKFEPGMRVSVEGVSGIVAEGPSEAKRWPSDAVQLLKIAGGNLTGWWPVSSCTADLDHPGTRGLLLQQYRDASGHARAFCGWSDEFSAWGVILEDGKCAGHCLSEGAAILDALTRLAAERTRESEQAKSVEGSEAILRALLTETQAAMEKLTERLAAAEGRLVALEGKAWQ